MGNIVLNDETVWLTQEQIAQVFSVGRPAITKHIRNIYNCGELDEDSTCSILEHMGNAGQQAYHIRYYNLDMILSVGYRVNSRNAVSFRRWASEILKEYLLRGYSINQRMMDFENRVNAYVFATDLARHNAQYPAIMITEAKNIHDRFLIVDDDNRVAARWG